MYAPKYAFTELLNNFTFHRMHLARTWHHRRVAGRTPPV